MWVIDIRHWLDETQTQAAIPRLRSKIKKLSEIILYATSLEVGLSIQSAPLCWRRPKRKPCQGHLVIALDPDIDEIRWTCPACGDEGVVSGWAGLIWDMTDVSSEYFH